MSTLIENNKFMNCTAAPLQLGGPPPVVGTTLDEVMRLGEVFKASGYFRDVRDQAQAVTKILYGRELGFTPIVSMMGIHIIEGKPALSANLLATLIKRSGKYNYRVKVWNETACVLEFLELINGKWQEVGESSFSIDDAKRARIKFTSDNGHPTSWTKFPKAMLFARALSQGERTYCPDVGMCPLYVPEELGATVSEEGEVTELPKSARPVEVSTEEIEIGGRPAVMSSVGNEQGGGPALSAEESGSPGIEPAQSQTSIAGVAGDAKAVTPADKYATEYINLPQQRAFHRQFREALPEDTQQHAEKLAADWLKRQGFVNDDGKASTKVIPQALFVETLNAAVRWAKGLHV